MSLTVNSASDHEDFNEGMIMAYLNSGQLPGREFPDQDPEETTGLKSNSDRISELAKEIISEGRNGNYEFAMGKLINLENLGADSETVGVIIEKMFETGPKMKGLSFIRRIQSYLGTENQDGLLHPETLTSLLDLVIESSRASSKGYIAKAKEINNVIDHYSKNFSLLQTFSQETKNFQEFLEMKESEQTGIINEKTLLKAAKLYKKTEKVLETIPNHKPSLKVTWTIKSYLAGLEENCRSRGLLI
jgi:hypothetical protein